MENKFYSIYGARLSQSKKRVNISIVTGEDDKKQWGTISLKLNNENAKTKVSIKDGYAFIKIPLLQESKQAEETPKTEDIPF